MNFPTVKLKKFFKSRGIKDNEIDEIIKDLKSGYDGSGIDDLLLPLQKICKEYNINMNQFYRYL